MKMATCWSNSVWKMDTEFVTNKNIYHNISSYKSLRRRNQLKKSITSRLTTKTQSQRTSMPGISLKGHFSNQEIRRKTGVENVIEQNKSS